MSEETTTNGCLRVVAIDGPAGSGKSTVAKRLADRLGLDYLDTGAMYRAVTFAVLQRGMDPVDADDVARLAGRVDIDVDDAVTVDGVDATIEIRGPEVTRAVSAVASNSEVRRELVRRQREWVSTHGGEAVVEGRDIGTVVFPDADLKVFFTARLDVRAGRRHREVVELDYEAVAADMARRDTVDTERRADPLAMADGAVLVDTSDRTVEEIVDDLAARL